MTVKFQIAKQRGSKPIYILMVALTGSNLRRYSEQFSGSGWAWLALGGNLLLLFWLLFSMISDYRNDHTVQVAGLKKARHEFSSALRAQPMR
jgi:hypothetical protein